MADLKNALPKTWGSPTMSPHCADEEKYGIVDKIAAQYQEAPPPSAASVAGQKIRDLVTVNGVRVMLEDGTWGLVRASSNKPELVIVVESPTSEANMRAIFADIDRDASRSSPKSANTIRRSSPETRTRNAPQSRRRVAAAPIVVRWSGPTPDR